MIPVIGFSGSRNLPKRVFFKVGKVNKTIIVIYIICLLLPLNFSQSFNFQNLFLGRSRIHSYIFVTNASSSGRSQWNSSNFTWISIWIWTGWMIWIWAGTTSSITSRTIVRSTTFIMPTRSTVSFGRSWSWSTPWTWSSRSSRLFTALMSAISWSTSFTTSASSHYYFYCVVHFFFFSKPNRSIHTKWLLLMQDRKKTRTRFPTQNNLVNSTIKTSFEI